MEQGTAKKNIKWVNEARNIAFLFIGSLLIALGVVLFLAPNNIASGGTPGAAILLHHLTGLSIGTLMLCVNIPLLLMGYRILGTAFTIRTVVATILSSAFVELFIEYLHLQPASDEFVLSALFGGIIIGTGVGCVLRGNGSSGGSTIIARILAHRYRIRPGRTILLLDMLIILSSAFVFNGIEPSLWSLISIYAASRCIDIVITGSSSERIVHIVTDKVTEISDSFSHHIGPNGTIVSGKSLVNGEQKTMIFVVVENRRIPVLRKLIDDQDPTAFVVVMEASELMGRGH